MISKEKSRETIPAFPGIDHWLPLGFNVGDGDGVAVRSGLGSGEIEGLGDGEAVGVGDIFGFPFGVGVAAICEIPAALSVTFTNIPVRRNSPRAIRRIVFLNIEASFVRLVHLVYLVQTQKVFHAKTIPIGKKRCGSTRGKFDRFDLTLVRSALHIAQRGGFGRYIVLA